MRFQPPIDKFKVDGCDEIVKIVFDVLRVLCGKILNSISVKQKARRQWQQPGSLKYENNNLYNTNLYINIPICNIF